MSVAVSRTDGVTVLTLTSDQSSACPPLCQLLGALCYSPALCSVRRPLTFQRGGAQSALGALWIITGILHIGLGTIFLPNEYVRVFVLWFTGYSRVWLGVLFMFFGVCCVLAERYPRPIVVLLSGLLNLAGIALSITAIVLYTLQILTLRISFTCERIYWDHLSHWRHYDYDPDWTPPPPTPVAPEQLDLLERCEETQGLMRVLSFSILAVLIALSALDLCLGLSSAILSFKSLKKASSKSENKPLLKEAKAITE